MNKKLEDRIRNLPIDIRFYILPYTYRLQSKEIQEDILSFVQTKKRINQVYHYRWTILNYSTELDCDKYWLINDIFRFMNEYQPLNRGYVRFFYSIFTRNRMMVNLSNLEIERILFLLEQRYHVTHLIGFLWGLLTPFERDSFIGMHASQTVPPYLLT